VSGAIVSCTPARAEVNAMRSRKWATVAATVILTTLCAASEARAQAVVFKAVRDAVPGKFFSADKSTLDPANPNHLIVGFDNGFDPVTLIANDFRASALPFSNKQAMDSLTFTLKAPTGFYIATVTYTQSGTGSTGRTDVEAGAATWLVASHPFLLGTFSSNPNLARTVDLRASRLTSVPVVISVSLFAQTGSVSVTGADVVVTLGRF
jgi:hypothetical protein